MTKTVLHVGCGGNSLPTWLGSVKEIRLDIDDTYKPDIVADMRGLGDIGKYDVVYCSHAIEHLYPHEVMPVLNNFRSVLNSGGMAIVIVPNLDGIKPTNEMVYISDAGKVTGLDMIYGMASMIKKEPYMAHHTGFVPETLREYMEKSGFSKIHVMADDTFNIIGVGVT